MRVGPWLRWRGLLERPFVAVVAIASVVIVEKILLPINADRSITERKANAVRGTRVIRQFL